MKTIAIINQKGGVGKTTTALTLAVGLRRKGFRTLLVDLDPQINLTMTTGTGRASKTALGVLTEEVTAKEAIQQSRNFGDLIPASKNLTGADSFITGTGKEYTLREALEPISKDYDYCIIDTPPALGILTVNALTACQEVIIPAQADLYSLQGITQLLETIGPVKKYTNPDITIRGILLTRFNPRTTLSREVQDLMKEKAKELGTTLFQATIREAIAVKESQILGENLFSYKPSANVTKDYEQFIEEFIGETKQ
jgi:chromosome partitioning protein